MSLPQSWIYPTEAGLYCAPGRFFIDPRHGVDRAVITHGHSDHARPGHGALLATPETVEVLRVRLGPDGAGSMQALALGEPLVIGDTVVTLRPAGHILGSAQVVIEHGGQRVVVSGDYKRLADPTCEPFEVVPCDVFVTEATFALPVFRHERPEDEIARLMASVAANPQRAHLIGVYSLGKCQRLLMLLRAGGYDRPIYLHGALQGMTDVYRRLGFDFGELRSATTAPPDEIARALVLCPPSALADRWSQRFDDPIRAVASGWMRVRGQVRQRNIELPLVISDHADWPELLDTIAETGAGEVWVTHGREDALVHEVSKRGVRARALSLVGYEDEGE